MKARMFEVKINLGNAEMQTSFEVGTALLGVAKYIRNLDGPLEGHSGTIMDINGNAVGKWRVV